MDIKQRIESAKARVKQAESALTVAETQEKAAQEQIDAVVKEMQAVGVTPETIEHEIAQLNASIIQDLDKIDTLLPPQQPTHTAF